MRLSITLLLMTAAVSSAAVTIHSDFEGGNIGEVVTLSDSSFRCPVVGESDQDHRNRQADWYYFRVDGAKGKPLTIDLVDLPGEYNYQPNRGAITADTLPWISGDQRNWTQLQTVEYLKDIPSLRLHVTPPSDHFWIAHVPPYTNADLARLMKDVESSPFLEHRVIGKTAGGRDMLLLTITGKSVADSGKKVLWLMFRQHSWEAGSSWSGEGALRFLLSNDAEAAAIRRTTIVKVFPLCDPDGVARGGVRFNVNGFDLNRNWDVVDAQKMPEITVQRKAVFDWMDSGHTIDVYLSLHNTETNEYLEGPPDPTGAVKPLMERLFTALSQSPRFAASKPPSFAAASTTVGKPGRMDARQGLYHDRGIPSFLIEMRIAKHPKLGHAPTIDDRKAFGVDLVKAMRTAVK